MKFIYLIQSLEDSSYKIGVSIHPTRRLSALQTGNSSELKLVETFQSEYPHLVERALQRKYIHLKKEGEWFDFGISEEVSFLTNCKQIEETINDLKESGNVFI